MMAEKAGLVLPMGYRSHTRTGTAVILDSDVPGWYPGDRLLLTSGAGRRFLVGMHAAEEVELVRIGPGEILARLERDAETEQQPAHILRNFEGRSDLRPEEDDKWEEGDPEGLR